mmetsp:Transcript_8033/g.12194  ORF Transcript_8033/g.12194 Transcript_8033/m.12194 type:complete len:90 (-) Transcript_8033:141-410(-)|eukprot:scaffold2891_cov72-Skeletonema_dohrnii-CCMP3373.AAC.2
MPLQTEKECFFSKISSEYTEPDLLVGDIIGLLDGDAVGFACRQFCWTVVSGFVGLLVGDDVGLFCDGDDVGLLVGASVGLLDGDVVGAV